MRFAKRQRSNARFFIALFAKVAFKEAKLQFIDIHAHIIPGVDDGAANDTAALKMLKMSYESGVRNIILTPHYNEKMNFTADAFKELEHMEGLAAQVAGDLHLFMGNEVYYSGNVLGGLKSKRILTLAGSRYVLVEFPFAADYKKILDGAYELIMHGYWPVIAHAERYGSLCREPDGAERLADLGAYIQVNANSVFSGSFGVRRFIKRLIRSDLVSFVATDCHNTSSRAPDFGSCARLLANKYGEETAKALTFKNQEQILQNKRIPR